MVITWFLNSATKCHLISGITEPGEHFIEQNLLQGIPLLLIYIYEFRSQRSSWTSITPLISGAESTAQVQVQHPCSSRTRSHSLIAAADSAELSYSITQIVSPTATKQSYQTSFEEQVYCDHVDLEEAYSSFIGK